MTAADILDLAEIVGTVVMVLTVGILSYFIHPLSPQPGERVFTMIIIILMGVMAGAVFAGITFTICAIVRGTLL